MRFVGRIHMREIKFKAQAINSDKWIEGYYFAKPILNRHFIICDDAQWEIKPDTLCQSTELNAYWTSKGTCELKSQAVWEHDLLEVNYEGETIAAEVKYEAGMFILASDKFIDSYIPLYDTVVLDGEPYIDAKHVGTVFDNPQKIKDFSFDDLHDIPMDRDIVDCIIDMKFQGYSQEDVQAYIDKVNYHSEQYEPDR